MPKIYDNQEVTLLSGLSDALVRSYRSDISVGYFNMRGWKKLASKIEQYKGGEDNQCRLLLGMYSDYYSVNKEVSGDDSEPKIDNSTAKKLKKETIANFRKQLMRGVPSNEDERALRKLAKQIKEKKVVVKCFARHSLHAKLYLTFNKEEFAKKIGFLGSSNLTYAGLERQGELNIDVLDQGSCDDLDQWFNKKWDDIFSIDISDEIVEIIEESWASENLLSPYQIYIKMAYHLSEDARKGLSDFFIPKNLEKILFPFQSSAVRIAAHHVQNKGGVLMGDVVGLGKTLMAISIAKIFEEEHGYQTLILCPKNLEGMWNDHKDEFGLRGKVMSIGIIQSELPKLRRHHLVILDESHNFRNPNIKKYKALKDYISTNDCKCILLSATPYNKTYIDLSSQLGLFIDKDQDLGIKPEKFLKENDIEFSKSCLRAFEKSQHAEDWQQLMAQFLVRRTRSFIKENYGEKDSKGRYYLKHSDGKKNYFPERVPQTIRYPVDSQYKKLFSEEVVSMISDLSLARYALSQYKKNDLGALKAEEENIFKDIERGRSYPKGFCRINLFKRLESSGYSFLLSVQRLILRNYIFIYAIETNQAFPVGEKHNDIVSNAFEGDEDEIITGLPDQNSEQSIDFLKTEDEFYNEAEKLYRKHVEKNKKNAKWISSTYFNESLKEDLLKDTHKLLDLLKNNSDWNPKNDKKLKHLEDLIKNDFKGEKVIIFSQSKDTSYYIYNQLKQRNIDKLAVVTGGSNNIQDVIKAFSPISNGERRNKNEIDVLITTDVLSEGQNLQDCHIIINYDLPWAIIKLIQRVGRIDRIGQKSDKIICGSFMPDTGLEDLIDLKGRVKRRLQENAEVIGTDEKFFDDDKEVLMNLYNEQSDSLEELSSDSDIDLSSYALEIWNQAIKNNPELEKTIKELPDVVHSSKQTASKNEELLLYAKTNITNYLIHLSKNGESITENQFEILKLASCDFNENPLERDEKHYDIIKKGLGIIQKSMYAGNLIGALGTSRSIRRKLFEKISKCDSKNETIQSVAQDLFEYPLLNNSESVLNKMFRRKESDQKIIDYAIENYNNETLLNKKEIKKIDEKPRIVCSMGLLPKN